MSTYKLTNVGLAAPPFSYEAMAKIVYTICPGVFRPTRLNAAGSGIPIAILLMAGYSTREILDNLKEKSSVFSSILKLDKKAEFDSRDPQHYSNKGCDLTSFVDAVRSLIKAKIPGITSKSTYADFYNSPSRIGKDSKERYFGEICFHWYDVIMEKHVAYGYEELKTLNLNDILYASMSICPWSELRSLSDIDRLTYPLTEGDIGSRMERIEVGNFEMFVFKPYIKSYLESLSDALSLDLDQFYFDRFGVLLDSQMDKIKALTDKLKDSIMSTTFVTNLSVNDHFRRKYLVQHNQHPARGQAFTFTGRTIGDIRLEAEAAAS